MRLTVISGGRTPFRLTASPKHAAIHAARQHELAALSARAKHIVAPNSGHCPQITDPGMVVETVREIVASTSGPWVGDTDPSQMFGGRHLDRVTPAADHGMISSCGRGRGRRDSLLMAAQASPSPPCRQRLVRGQTTPLDSIGADARSAAPRCESVQATLVRTSSRPTSVRAWVCAARETVGVGDLGWLSEYSEPALRSALRVAGARLDRLPIELTGTNDLSRPTWATGSATIDARLLAKFAFSERTAVRVWREACVLELLGKQPGFDVPELIAASPNPAFLVTRLVERGVPLSYDLVRASIPERVHVLGAELAGFLAKLHAPEILTLAKARLGEPLGSPEPGLQATTDELRLRFAPMIDYIQRERVDRWCDWVDRELSAAGEVVFVHGDFHPYNQLWDARHLRLLLVADFETSGAAEPEYDFRAIPSFGPGVDLLTSTVDRYIELTGRRLNVKRIMALHLCTTLGDALWRSEAGLPLLLPRPGGGSPADYVDELAARFELLGIEH